MLMSQMRRLLPSDVKTWQELKVWASRNPGPGYDDEKLLLLQALHFQDMASQIRSQHGSNYVQDEDHEENSQSSTDPLAVRTDGVSAREAKDEPKVYYTPTGRASKAKKGLKVHTCEDCGQSFTRAEHLSRHQKRHSKVNGVGDINVSSHALHNSDAYDKHEEELLVISGESRTDPYHHLARGVYSSLVAPNEDTLQAHLSVSAADVRRHWHNTPNIPPGVYEHREGLWWHYRPSPEPNSNEDNPRQVSDAESAVQPDARPKLGKTLYEAAKEVFPSLDTQSVHETTPEKNLWRKDLGKPAVSLSSGFRTAQKESEALHRDNLSPTPDSPVHGLPRKFPYETCDYLVAGAGSTSQPESHIEKAHTEGEYPIQSVMASLGSGFTNPMSDLKGYADGARESIQRVLQEEGDNVIDTSSAGPPPEQNNNWNEMYQGARDEDVEPVQPREHGTIGQPSHQTNAGQKIQINQTHKRAPILHGVASDVSARVDEAGSYGPR
jgi:hypothetical protein